MISVHEVSYPRAMYRDHEIAAACGARDSGRSRVTSGSHGYVTDALEHHYFTVGRNRPAGSG
jgi:hypothetical protein